MSKRQRHPSDPPSETDPELAAAVATLARIARRRLERHPQGHLAGSGRRPSITLGIDLPLGGDPDGPAVREASQEMSIGLDDEIAALLAHRSAFVHGHVWCLRCARADCEHSMPGGPREVFVGYGSTGVPRFLDFAQWLLERQDPRVDILYKGGLAKGRRELVTVVDRGTDLTADVLDAWKRPAPAGDNRHGADPGPDPMPRATQTRVEVLGQVAAGWFPVRPDGGGERELALTFQIIASSRPEPSRPARERRRRGKRRGAATAPRRRLTLNVVGAGADGTTLHDLESRLDPPPWKSIGTWSQSVLESIERSERRMKPDHFAARIEGVLGSIARRLEQGRRGQERRTRHAEDRHQSGERPTRMALADLAEAKDDRFLRDTLRDTVVVLGDRGRAHVFSAAGKLVTSLRSSPEATERKIARGRWKPATSDEVAKLRAAQSMD